MKNFISGLFKKKNTESQPATDSGPSEKSEKPKAEAPKNEAVKVDPAPKTNSAPKAEPRPAVPSPTAESKPFAAPVLVSLYGKKEPVVVEVVEAKAIPYLHLPFEGELQAVIQTLVEDLSEVYPQTFEQWEDGFRCDENPEQEIAAWTHVAAVLKAMDAKYSLAVPEKSECFNVLMACFTGSRETVPTRFKRSLLTVEQFSSAISYFYEGGY